MKKIFLLTILIALVTYGFAVLSEYSFLQETANYTEITNPTVIHTVNIDDAMSAVIDIGFTFLYDEVTYTQFKCNSNGFITLNPSSTASLSNALATQTLILGGLWDDLKTDATDASVAYELTGTAPNRILKVQYKNMKWYYSASPVNLINFQIWLSETTNTVKFIYGAMGATPGTSASASIGISGAVAGNFKSVTPASPTASVSSTTEFTAINGTHVPFLTGFQYTFAPPVANQPPNPAIAVSPLPGATTVAPYATLNWSSGGNLPSGYRLSFGTNNPPTNIANNVDLGNVNTYDPPGDMAYSTTYYWKIVPYNAFGNASNCPIWSFTTYSDPSITTLPYTQNFDAVTAPALPFDWSMLYQSTVTTGYVKTVTTSPYSTPNCVAIYNSSDVAGHAILIAPPVSQTVSVNTLRVKFWGKGSAAYYLRVGVMTNPADASTFTEIQNVNVVANWNQYVISLGSYTGTGRYIAFKHANAASSQTLYVDNVEIEVNPTNDLAALSITGNTTPTVNLPTNYTVSVYNWGSQAQSNYQVKLYNSSNTELASVSGTIIAPGATVPVVVSWTPTSEGPAVIYGKVILTGDQNPTNDQTGNMNITVQPAGALVVTIGEGNLAEGVPLEFYYKNSLFECLYYPSEIGVFGLITALTFYNNFVTNLTDKPCKFWLGQTNLADLSGGWITSSDLTLVYDGTMNFPSGINTITIPLQTPFVYTSGNLVLYANRPMDTAYFNTNDNFAAQTIGANRARKLYSDSVTYDPAAPSATGTLSGTFPKTSLTFIVNGMGSLSGTVTSGGSPVSGVAITINTTTYSGTTNANGVYNFPYVTPGTYTVTASKIGFETQTLPVTIVADQASTLNFALVQSASVNVTGTVVGSDAPTVGLANATINLTGLVNYSGTTNEQGQFTIPGVLSGNTYNYTIAHAGYQNATGSISVGASNYSMGTVILSEMTLPPVSVTAALNQAETQVTITWRAPGSTGGFYFNDFNSDNGGWVPSSNWTNPLGDFEWSATYNSANFVATEYATSCYPPTEAHSGTGLWGTKLNTNYTNAGGFSYLTQTFNFSSISNPVLRFWSWNNSFGDFDYGQIKVNGNLVWGPQWDTSPFSWQERVIDLTAYGNMANVQIQFQHYTTTVVAYAGWYIDDVYIGAPQSLAQIRSISPKPNYQPIIYADKNLESSLNSTHAAIELSARSNRSPVNNYNRIEVVNHPTPLDDRPIGYKVWRLLQGNEQNEGTWVLLTTNAITDTFYVNTGWQSLPDGIYKWAVKTVYLNNVFSNAAFSNTIRKQPNDMSATSIVGSSTPTVGTASIYTIHVINTGTASQPAGAYTVKLMTGTTELASVAGPALAVNASADVQVPWTPSVAGPMIIFGKTVLPNDSVPTNDQTPNFNVDVYPTGVYGITIGDGSQNARMPLDFYYKNSLYECIYTQAELGNFVGMIMGIKLYNQFTTTTLTDKPTKLWLGTTTLTDLSAGYIPSTALTQVFDGTVSYPAGANEITITFPQPFMYLTGGNLVLMANRPMDTAYFSSSDYFKCQTWGNNRARNVYSDGTTYDPAAPPAGTLTGQFPKTTFVAIPGGVGHLQGTVTGAGGTPLSGVTVAIPQSIYTTTTNASGQYSIMNIIAGNYSVNFTRYGYITQTQNITITEDQTLTLNVTMTQMPTVVVSGVVYGSDVPGVGLSGVTVSLTGYENYNVTTNANGQFSIPGVYANQSYQYVIMHPNYQQASGTIDVLAVNYNMGDIILSEFAYAPRNVQATEAVGLTAVDLNWLAPDPDAVSVTESFESTTYPPTGWTQVITNTDPPNTSGVLGTWCRFGAVTISGTPVDPTEGSNQTGLWWSYNHQDEWLITPQFNCPANASVRFDSYVFLGSTAGDHYYVKVSTNGGSTWTVIWDASTQTGGWNYYATPIMVSLAAYSGQQIKLAWHAKDPSTNDGLWYTWFMDNIQVGNGITSLRFTPEELTRISADRTAVCLPLVTDAPISRAAFLSASGNRNQPSVPARLQRDNRSLQGYKVWRLQVGQEANETAWSLLTQTVIPVGTLNYSDTGWAGIPNGSYKWAVKAVYTGGVASLPAFSNVIVKDVATGNIAGVVRNPQNQLLPNATVTAGSFSATTNASGAYILALPAGTHSVTASHPNYGSVTQNNVVVNAYQTTTLNFVLTVANDDEVIPVTATALHANYPNPFNPRTTISYAVKDACHVRLQIYNAKGQLIKTLVDEQKGYGNYNVTWNGTDNAGKHVSSGIYLYRMHAGKYVSTKKMMLMQ